MKLNRWACVHGRPDQPGYRLICSVHWTKQGAAQQATGLQQAAWAAGYKHTYWVEKLMGDDKPGDYYLVAPPVII
jgi:hypothetical protein